MLLTRPLLSRELVGREQELEQLRQAQQRAASGYPQFVLLSGEAGIGKTRLCRTLVQTSVEPALRFWGRAHPQNQTIPFGPFLDAFRRSVDTLIHSLERLDQTLRSSFIFLAQLLPEVASRFPDLTTSLPNQMRSPAMRQQVLFHDILMGFHTLTHLHQQPLVLVLEDLHWADETSLELLTFLARQLDANITAEPSTPLLLLGNYRSEALHDNPAFQQMVRHLQAGRYVTELRLSPLSITEHRRCVTSILDQEVSEEFADFLFTWDEGNPFYTEELLGTMAARGHIQVEPQGHGWFLPQQEKPDLPASITAAILERFERLSPLDQEVLTVASVLGRAFDFPLLVAVCDQDEYTLVDVLSRAIRSQFLSEVITTRSSGPGNNVSGRYHFRHALIHEAIYGRMHTAERYLRHRIVAEAIERLLTVPPATVLVQHVLRDQVAALLAKHYQLAGLLERARPYALEEARRASGLCAFREERYYLDLAQASLPVDSSERVVLLERLGRLSMGIYDFEESLRWLTLAQTCFEPMEQHLHVLRVQAQMILPQWFLAHPSLLGLIAEIEAEAEQLFGEAEQAYQHVELLTVASHLALYRVSHGQLRRASYWIERSKRLYAVLNDSRKVEEVQVGLIAGSNVKANQHTVLAEEGIDELRHVLQYARQSSLPEVLIFGYVHLGIILLFRGKHDEVEQVFQEAIAHERRSGTLQPSFVYGWHHFFAGRWEEGITLLRTSIERLQQANIPMLAAVEGMVLAHILLARNELSQAQALLQLAHSLFEPLQQQSYLLWTEWGFAKLFTAQGNQPQAQLWYERLLQQWKNTEDTLLIPPMLLDGIRFYAQSSYIAKAQQWVEELQNVVAVSNAPVGVAALKEAEGIIAEMQGEQQQAIEALRQAVESWKTLRWLYRQAEASLQLAEALLRWTERRTMKRLVRQKAREEAEVLLDNAQSLYERLQVPTGLEKVQTLRTHAHVDAQRKRRNAFADQHAAHGLTRKEMQVLTLLAAGRTNKEIAAQLSITVGTVELHVTHILTKLQCETRTQAATYAVAQGWVTPRHDEDKAH